MANKTAVSDSHEVRTQLTSPGHFPRSHTDCPCQYITEGQGKRFPIHPTSKYFLSRPEKLKITYQADILDRGKLSKNFAFEIQRNCRRILAKYSELKCSATFQQMHSANWEKQLKFSRFIEHFGQIFWHPPSNPPAITRSKITTRQSITLLQQR